MFLLTVYRATDLAIGTMAKNRTARLLIQVKQVIQIKFVCEYTDMLNKIFLSWYKSLACFWAKTESFFIVVIFTID